MATQIIFKRGANDPTAASGLTLAEPAFNYTTNTFWIGKGTGVAPVWVGAGICGASGSISSGITYQVPTASAVKDYISGYIGTSITDHVTSFNGKTGAVTGASLGANTFTGLNTFNAGITTSALYVSSTGITSAGNIRFAGTSPKSIISTTSSLTVGGATSSTIVAYNNNSIVFGNQITDPLTLYSASSVFDFTTTNSGIQASNPSLRLVTYDAFNEASGSLKLQSQAYFSGDWTQYLQDTSGTIALTSQLMGTVNGSTAATTAVTSFNGLTGAVSGVTTSVANTFTPRQTFLNGICTASTSYFNGVIYGNAGLYLPNSTTSPLATDLITSYQEQIIVDGLGNGLYLTDSSAITIDSQNPISIGDIGIGTFPYMTVDPSTTQVTLGGMNLGSVGTVNCGAITAVGNISTTGTVSSYSLGGSNPGVTTGIRVYTYPDGATTSSVKTQYYQPTYCGRDASGTTVQANRTYFSLFYTPVSRTIKSIRMETENTGATGSAYFGIYSADSTTGLPKTRLYGSASTVVANSYSQTTLSGVNYAVPAGWFYLGVCCSLAPKLYGYGKSTMQSVFGSGANSDGYQNYCPVADTSGFTLPASLPATGVTFALIDYVPVNYVGVRLEYGV